MKNTLIAIIIGILVIIPLIGLYQNQSKQQKSSARENLDNKKQITKPSIVIDNHFFKLEVARTFDEKTKGLSGRTSIAHDNGMLFVFNKPDIYDFWMKGMKFPLDIIWIYNNKIVTIADNLQPTAETNILKIPRFKSVLPADTVLEIPAGLSNKYNLKVGDRVDILL